MSDSCRRHFLMVQRAGKTQTETIQAPIRRSQSKENPKSTLIAERNHYSSS
jgi:hypothetical protein